MIPFAQPQTQLPLLKLTLKIFLPLYTQIDYEGKRIELFVLFNIISYIGILFMRFKYPSIYNKKVQNFSIFCESLMFWISLCVLITLYIDEGQVDNIGLLYLVIGIPFIWSFYNSLINYRNLYMMRKSIKSFKTDQEVEMYINILIEMIENRENPQTRIILEGILKFHSRQCFKEGCFCHQFLMDDTKEEEVQILQKKWYIFLKNIIEDMLEKFNKSSRLHLLHSYIQNEKLKNKFKALIELMIIIQELKPNIQQEFQVFRFCYLIEEEIIENDQKGGEGKSVDVNKIVLFQKEFINFQHLIARSVQLHLDFWRELLEENPEIQKIQQTGQQITQTVEQVNEKFQKLKEIYSQHIKCLEIYGNFLKNIVNDNQEGDKILDNVNYAKNSQNINKQFVDSDKLKYGENSSTSIITCSSNYNQIGIVTNVNNELTRILGWSKSDIIDQNIYKIMPKVYGEIHNQLMRRYSETSEPKVIGIERLVLCQHKNQYLVPCTLMIKILPNLDEGITIVGFIKDVENNTNNNNIQLSEEKVHYMIYRTDNDAIQGISISVFNSFGIPAALMYGNTSGNLEFTIDVICQELTNPEIIELMKNPQGVLATIDTTQIQKKFLLEQEDSQDLTMHISSENNQIHSQQQQQNSKFKRQKVRVYLIEQQIFEDRKVNVIKFVEVEQNTLMDDVKSKAQYAQDINDIQIRNNLQSQIDKKDVNSIMENQKVNFSPENDNFIGEDRESNVSNTTLNDEFRQLKDFKSLISERNIPKSIKILQSTVILVILFVFALCGIEIWFKIQQFDKTRNGIDSIFYGYQRHNIMADVNYITRKLWSISNLYYSNQDIISDQLFQQQQEKLQKKVFELQHIQFEIIKGRIYLEKSFIKHLEEIQYSIYFLLQNGDIKPYQNCFTNSIIQYITSASQLVYSEYDNLLITNQIFYTTSPKNFYFVTRNGLFILRQGSEDIAQELYDYYINQIMKYRTNFLTIMILGTSLFIISQFILIPIVFQVLRTNTRVLSLFGMINIQEIKDLVQKCEKYSQQFLDEENFQEQQKEQQNIEINNEIGKEEDKNNNQKNEELKKKRLEEEEINKLRSEKLINSKDNNKKKVIFQFFFVVVLFLSYFIISFVLEIIFLNDISTIFQHLNYISKRNPILKYNLLYTFEQISTNLIQQDDNKQDLKEQFTQKIYQNENDIFNSYKESYPSEFDKYKDNFRIINYDNLCENFTWDSPLNEKECASIDDKIIEKGLRIAIVSYAEDTRKLLTQFWGGSRNNLQQTLSGQEYLTLENIQKYIVPSIEYSNQLFIDCIKQFINNQQQIMSIKLGVFIFFLNFVFIVLWIPYQNMLSQKIWRTKGMLHMIPMDIITKDNNLKQAFASGDILQAVK
ncbi:PAS domain S-box family protein [Ichthyophthirius multifiliis]|uniref:PAS domain S-box family protein n=1 Tax=Ichthyophthirius multifiliis TaxID=5932 RepID=G0QNB0_ICHMU|nr:PAS domain S-box family protein [Ichthyophthirius multifiliis]EGR33302.1 PAS domain S-box family protein [Ichthyophthirius multifiliis]|eukprot:XP_004037288.1 PAS domain S-box family protein [Ichthyophthirius multifiliis]